MDLISPYFIVTYYIYCYFIYYMKTVILLQENMYLIHRPLNCHMTQLCMTQLCMTQLCMTQLCMTQLCMTQLCMTQLCMTQLCMTQLCMTQLCILSSSEVMPFTAIILLLVMVHRTVIPLSRHTTCTRSYDFK